MLAKGRCTSSLNSPLPSMMAGPPTFVPFARIILRDSHLPRSVLTCWRHTLPQTHFRLPTDVTS